LSNHSSEQMHNVLMGLKADIVIKSEDTPRYEAYLHRAINAEKEFCAAKRLVHLKQELLRCRLSKFLNNQTDGTMFETLLRQT